LLLSSLIFCWTNGFNFSSSFKEINNPCSALEKSGWI
jgi:hypothetical protein